MAQFSYFHTGWSIYSIQHEMRSIREHLKKISDNSEQTCKVREHLKKIGDNSESNAKHS